MNPMFQVACPYCGATVRAPDNLAGRSVRCPKCKGVLKLPQSPAAAAELTFDHEPARPRRGHRRRSSAGLIAAVVVAVLLVPVLGFGVVYLALQPAAGPVPQSVAAPKEMAVGRQEARPEPRVKEERKPPAPPAVRGEKATPKPPTDAVKPGPREPAVRPQEKTPAPSPRPAPAGTAVKPREPAPAPNPPEESPQPPAPPPVQEQPKRPEVEKPPAPPAEPPVTPAVKKSRDLEQAGYDYLSRGEHAKAVKSWLEAMKYRNPKKPEDSRKAAELFCRIGLVYAKTGDEEVPEVKGLKMTTFCEGAATEALKGGGITGEQAVKEFLDPIKEDTTRRLKPSVLNAAAAELAAAAKVQAKELPEPLAKPALMTQQEYEFVALRIAKTWLERDEATTVRWFVGNGLALPGEGGDLAEQIMPRHLARWRREAIQRTLEMWGSNQRALEDFVARATDWRFLLDPDEQKRIRSRASWDKRKEYYKKLAQITGQKERYSLLLPFDDLTEAEMKDVLVAAALAKEKGLLGLDREQRLLLLRAGAYEFFRHLGEAARDQ
jgi:hypothetical protein